jgi:O-antigen/teichoic acid export membrane protein
MTRSTTIVHGKRIAHNSLMNLGTGILIAALNMVFVPPMLHTFGTELYGVLSVTWVVLANLSFLDFGFSRASAKYVAHELGLARPLEACLWTWTAVITQAAMGGLGAVVLWIFAPNLVNHIHVTATQRDLVILTLRLFAFSIPLDFATRSMTGVIQAGQRFDWFNGLGLFSSLFTFATYTAGIVHGAHFLVVIYGLFILRILNLLGAYWGACKVLPELKSLPEPRAFPQSYRTHVVAMVRFGSWVAVAAVIGPLILYFDQWMISVIIGVALLPFYTIPFNLLSRLGLFPSSLTSTLFPAFSALEAKTEWVRMESYFVRSHRYLLTVLIPMIFVLFVWAPEILRLWIGADFALQASGPFRVLTLGYGISLLAPLSGALIEAVGRPDVLAKLYVVELPLNLISVWFLTKKFGVMGASISYSARALVETVLIWVVLYKFVPFSWRRFVKDGLLPPSLLLIPTCFAAYVIGSGHIRSKFDITATTTTLVLYSLCVFVWVLDGRDKKLVGEMFGTYKLRLAWKK